MPRNRKPSQQREMFDPQPSLLEEQEKEIFEEEREFVNLLRQAIRIGTVEGPRMPAPPKMIWPKGK